MSTPFMGLNLPSPLVTTGPGWAALLNAAFDVVDAHDHTPGFGVPVPSAGLNINADLDFQGHAAINLDSIILSSRDSVSLVASTFQSVNGDLVWVNAGGTQVPITAGNSIVGSPGNIQNLSSPAAAIYSSGTSSFRWFSGAAQMAGLDAGFLTLREGLGSTADGITLRAPVAGASTYSIYFPTNVPSTQPSGFRAINTSTQSGSTSVQGYAWLDNVTLEEYSAFGSIYYRVKAAGITTSKLADAPNGVSTQKINDSAVTTVKLADAPNGVTTAKVNAQAITTDKLADAPNGVTTAKITDEAITTSKLADAPNGVSTQKINDAAVTTAKIADAPNGVTTAKITDEAITTDKLANAPNGVTSQKISDGAITTVKLANSPNGVTTQKINDSAVTTIKIGNGQVTTEKLADAPSGVTSSKINDGAVITAKIGNLQVTTEKLANAPNGITTEKINANAVTSSKVTSDFQFAIQSGSVFGAIGGSNAGWETDIVSISGIQLTPDDESNLCISLHPPANDVQAKFMLWCDNSAFDVWACIRVRLKKTSDNTVLRTYVYKVFLRRKLVVTLTSVNLDVFYENFPGFTIIDSAPTVTGSTSCTVEVQIFDPDVPTGPSTAKANIENWALCVSRL